MNFLCDDIQPLKVYAQEKYVSLHSCLLAAGKDLVQSSYVLSLLFPL